MVILTFVRNQPYTHRLGSLAIPSGKIQMPDKLVSSAKYTSTFQQQRGRSFIKIRKRRGTKKNPCKVPYELIRQADVLTFN